MTIGCYDSLLLIGHRSLLPSCSFLPILLFLIPKPPSYFLPRMAQARNHRLAQKPPRERKGGHHARDHAGSRGLPLQRPARALPRPGPHAPISEEPLGSVCNLVFSIPLHAARRAIAAAPPLLKQRRRLYYMTTSCPRSA